MQVHFKLIMQDHLIIHFLKVGDGDCTVIELPDNKLMMIDIKNGRIGDVPDSNYINPIDYLQSHFPDNFIHRYIQTHPDMDHMDGFADLVQKYEIVNFWDTENEKEISDFQNFREKDWDAYKNASKGKELYFTRTTTPIAHETGVYEYDIFPISPTAQILSEAKASENWNKLSYVIFLKYHNFSLLLGGDVTSDVWENIYQWSQSNSTISSILSQITIFKASHHGRDSGYCGNDMLNLMIPQQIITDYSPLVKESANKKYEYFRDKNDETIEIQNIDSNNIIIDYNKNINKFNVKYS